MLHTETSTSIGTQTDEAWHSFKDETACCSRRKPRDWGHRIVGSEQLRYCCLAMQPVGSRDVGDGAHPADYALQHIVNRISESLLSCDTTVPGLRPAMTHQESHSCTPDLQQAMMHPDTEQVQSK